MHPSDPGQSSEGRSSVVPHFQTAVFSLDGNLPECRRSVSSPRMSCDSLPWLLFVCRPRSPSRSYSSSTTLLVIPRDDDTTRVDVRPVLSGKLLEGLASCDLARAAGALRHRILVATIGRDYRLLNRPHGARLRHANWDDLCDTEMCAIRWLLGKPRLIMRG